MNIIVSLEMDRNTRALHAACHVAVELLPPRHPMANSPAAAALIQCMRLDNRVMEVEMPMGFIHGHNGRILFDTGGPLTGTVFYREIGTPAATSLQFYTEPSGCLLIRHWVGDNWDDSLIQPDDVDRATATARNWLYGKGYKVKPAAGPRV